VSEQPSPYLAQAHERLRRVVVFRLQLLAGVATLNYEAADADATSLDGLLAWLYAVDPA
jgi:hypothetical protein